MKILGNFIQTVITHPKKIITFILIITLIFSIFASQAQMHPGEGDFYPDSEIAEANDEIREEYKIEENRVTILSISDKNILSLDSLLTQTHLEEKILEIESIDEKLEENSYRQNGTLSPPRLIASSIFINTTFSEIRGDSDENDDEDGPNSGFDNIPDMMKEAIMDRAKSLSPEEIREVLKGGDLETPMLDLNFEEYEPKVLDYLYDLDFFPLEQRLSHLLSEDYCVDNHSAEKSLTTIHFEEETDDEDILSIIGRIEEEIETIQNDNDNIEMTVFGDLVLDKEISEASRENLSILMPIAFLLVIIILSLVYRDFTDTFLSIIVLGIAITWIYGIGVILNFNVGNPMMTSIPVLIVGLGIDYGIHLTSRYREELRRNFNISKALTISGRRVGFALLLTTITTMIGFLSNLTSDISIIRQFGILCAVGIFSAFILMLTFYPAGKKLLDEKLWRRGKTLVKENKEKDNRKFKKGLYKAKSKLKTLQSPTKVIFILILLSGFGIYGTIQLEPEFEHQGFLPEDIEQTEALQVMMEDFNMTQESAYILVNGDITNPSVFRKLPEVEDKALESEHTTTGRNVHSPYSLGLEISDKNSSLYDETFSKHWQENIAKNNSLREDINRTDLEKTYQKLIEFNEEEADRVLNKNDYDFHGLVIRTPIKSGHEENAMEIKEDLETAEEILQDEPVDTTVSGDSIVSQHTVNLITRAQIRALLLTFGFILIILILIYKLIYNEPMLGVICLFPLIFSVIWIFGAMHYLNIPLNPITGTIASITVGLGVDFNIHITQRFLEDAEKRSDVITVLNSTMNHTGKALLATVCTTVSGFGILSFSIIPHLGVFGKTSALSILIAFITSVIVLPIFLKLFYDRQN